MERELKVNTLLHLLCGAERGGCESNAMVMVRGLPDWRHTVLVLGKPGPMSPEFDAAGATVRHAGVLRSGSRAIIRSVAEAARDFDPAAVIAWHGMVALPEILHALRDFTGSVLVHGGNPAHTMPRWVDWRYWLREKRLGRRCPATYVCCSRHVAESFERRRYLRRFSRTVLFNGVRPCPLPAHQPREIHCGDRLVIGMMARLDGIKDQSTLLRAFARIVDERPAARLELAGDGPRRSELEELALELGIAGSVEFLGTVSDIYATMADWDLFAFITTEREGMGNALAEAMTLGLPCVSTDLPPIREVAGDPATIALSPKGDEKALASALRSLIDDRDQRNRLGRAARERARAVFDRKTFVEGYARLIMTTGA